MADKIDTFDIAALERAVNDSATRVSAIWLSFVAFSAYLAAAASNVSHRQIFLEEPIKLPTINIDLPLVASAILLPLLFVVYHLYVLLQVVLLARTADAYNRAIEHGVAEGEDRTLLRQRLANTLFAQLFAGSSREREGVLGWLLRLMAWITLAIAPVLVLLLFEIKFLPYHSAAVTWTHRALIAIDLVAVLLLWAGAVDPRLEIDWRSLAHRWKTLAGAAAILLAACTLLTFPGESGRVWTGYVAASELTEGDVPECRIPSLFGFAGPGFDRLSLRGEDLVEDEKLARIAAVAKATGQKAYGSERTRVFRGRDLRCGRFAGADLRHVDFNQADLTGAVLRGAHLAGATFGGARLAGAILDGAQLQGAFFGDAYELARARVARPADTEQDSSSEAGADQSETFAAAELPGALLRSAQLQGAYLKEANLRGASLARARLQGATLDLVDLRAAMLNGAHFDGASLANAKLQGASLQAARLPGASLAHADLRGAYVPGARFEGADLSGAQLQGADLHGVHLEGALLERTSLQGAVIRQAYLVGARFGAAQLQGVQFQSALRHVVFEDSFLWRASNQSCRDAIVIKPRFDAVIGMSYARTLERPTEATPESIAQFIADTVADVPAAETKAAGPGEWPARLRRNLLEAPGGRSARSGETAWRDCVEGSKQLADADLQAMVIDWAERACRADNRYLAEALSRNVSRASVLDQAARRVFADNLLARKDTPCFGGNSLDGETIAALTALLKENGER